MPARDVLMWIGVYGCVVFGVCCLWLSALVLRDAWRKTKRKGGTMDEERKMGPLEAAMTAGLGKGRELIKYRYLNMNRKAFARSQEELADQIGRGGYLLSIPTDGWTEVIIVGGRVDDGQDLFTEEDVFTLCRQLDRNATKHRPGEPCSHPGCLSHVSHPCEGCGRIAGQAAEPVKGTHEETRPDNTRFLGVYPDSFVETPLGASCDDMAREIETLRRENRQLQKTVEMRTAARFYEYEYEDGLEEAARMVESYEWRAVAMFGQKALTDLAAKIRARVKKAPDGQAGGL